MFLITGYVIIILALVMVALVVSSAIQSQREDVKEFHAREARIAANLAAREARRGTQQN